jgi:hypothetical protein
MSEFQYYEFVAIDRPLNTLERKRLRGITSRATITSTRLVNTYEWGNFKADPYELVAQTGSRISPHPKHELDTIWCVSHNCA